MWKLPLLLVLTVPLGWRALERTQRIVERDAGLDLPPREELSKKKTALQELQTALDSRGSAEDLSGCVFRICAEPPRPSANRSLQPLALALTAHTETVAEVRSFARIYVELESDPAHAAEVRDAGFKSWLEERRAVVRDKKDREKTLTAELETLDAAVRAALRRREPGELKEAKEEVETMLGRLEKHRINCEGFRVLAAWAERRLAEQRITRDLLLVARDDPAIQKSGQRDETILHAGRYARLLDSTAEQELRALIRLEAARFCDGYLPPRMDGDAMVLYRTLEVPRENIWIKWKKGRPEANRYGEETRLIRTEFDEFHPPELSIVEHYFRKVNDGDDTFHDQIRPTPRNQAARHFNERRKTLAWTEKALKSLLNGCPVRWPNEASMPIPYRRAEHLLEAVVKQAALFASEKS